MMNLLPQSQKDALAAEYRLRLVVVALVECALALVVFSVLLLPALASVRGEAADAQEAFAILRAKSPAQDPRTREEVTQTNAILDLLRPAGAAAQSASSLLASVAGAVPPGVTITSIRYDDSKETQILLGGTAGTREDLLAFVTRLKQLPALARVESPISNFVRSDTLDYSITLSPR